MFEYFIHYVLPFIATVDLIVFIHLSGHLIGCRLFSVKIESVSVGLGPTLLRFNKGETVWHIRLLPIGGYVRPRFANYNAGASGKYIWAALAGSALNIFSSVVAISFLFMMVGVPAVQDGNVHLVQQSVGDGFLAALHTMVLTWSTWNTDTWGKIASSFTSGWMRLMFFTAIWSSQFGALNLLPLPRLDGWSIVRIFLVRFLGVERANKALKRIFQGIIALAVFIFVSAIYNDLVHLEVIEKIRNLFV